MFQNAINKTEFHRLLRTHELVSLHVVLDVRELLASVSNVDLAIGKRGSEFVQVLYNPIEGVLDYGAPAAT